MPPRLAAILCFIGICGLFYLDRSKDERDRTSWALWLPIVWLTIAGSRMLSQWLALSSGISFSTPDAYLEGSPVDRLLFTAMVAVSLLILVARRQRTAAVLRQNLPLIVFFAYCLASVVWSDYPFVSFKRWTKGVGNLTMILIVLTDPNPRAAIKRLVSSVGFVLIPLSVLLVKYYPEYGRGYLAWVWTPIYTGVATDKNGLGYDCLFFGLSALWCLTEGLREPLRQQRNRQLLINVVILLMTAWLFYKANSITPTIGFAIGSFMMLMLTVTRRPALVHVVSALAPMVIVVAFVILDLDTYAASAVGRDVSLTGRTELWAEVLRVQQSPVLGAGFESFWLGPRADYLWDKFWWRPNQAHNGYLETYLNLGMVGLLFLMTLIVSGYYHIMKVFKRDPGLAAFLLGLFTATCVYNLTEAAFKGIHPLWIAFLLSVAAPVLAEREEQAAASAPELIGHRPRILETEWARRQAPIAGGMSTRARTGASAR